MKPEQNDPVRYAQVADSGLTIADPHQRAFYIGLAIVVLSCISAVATFIILTGLAVIPRNGLVTATLVINVVLILAMIGVIASQAVGLWRAWRNKVAGIRLLTRILILFSVLAAAPALLLATVATTTFTRALDGNFTDRTRQIVSNALEVARTYVDEHGQIIRNDVANMARDVDAASAKVRSDPRQLKDLLLGHAGLRELNSAYIIDATGKVLATGLEDARFPFRPPPSQIIALAATGQIPIMQPHGTNHVSAMARLESFPGGYLYVARDVSPTVLAYLSRAEAGAAEFEDLRRLRNPLQVVHGLMFFMISLTGVLAALWAGLWFASRFVAPIGRLIGAAQQVSRGNLDVALPLIRGEGDMRRLSETFNTMTGELKTQRDALVAANAQELERRAFMEAVLSGVSAGVFGLDRDGHITLANRSAEHLLKRSEAELTGRMLAEVLPELAPLLPGSGDDDLKGRSAAEAKITIDGDERTFAVRVTRQREPSGGVQGAVVTLDDVTELVAAQRTSAWGEVARRMAHEIKNPLTPIILNVERIRKRFGKAITTDRDKFDELTATIERHAGNIKTMVDEFASFARLPKPVMETTDLREAVQDAVVLFRESHPKVVYRMSLPDLQVTGLYDRRLITQALTNLVKNATEAVESAAETAPADWRGEVETAIRVAADHYDIEVIDNGIGLPKQNRSRLTEPYVTTKGAKGTGLGLAIVQKITEQHGGALSLEDAPPSPTRRQGALIRISLPKVARLTAPAQPSTVAVKAAE